MLKDNLKTNKWVNAGNGCINIIRDLDKKSIRQILKEENLFQVQFYNRPNPRTWDLLNQYLFSERPDVYLKLIKYEEPLTDLDFLLTMNNLEHLYLDISDLNDLYKIGYLVNLKGLILSETKSKSYSLKPISRLDKLNYLQVTGLIKDIESLSHLRNLTELTLRSLTLDNLDFLSTYENLEKLHVILGGTKNFDALRGLPNLKYLELYQIRQLSDIEFISDLKNLEFLQLSSLRNISRLPDFTNSHNLRKLVLVTLKGLEDISSLGKIDLLEEFLFVAANNLTPEQFKVLQNCKNLRMATVGFGSHRKNKEFEQFCDSIGVNKFDWGKTKYL